MDLFARKSICSLLQEAKEEQRQGMKRVLGPLGLVAMGIGAIIGAGLFSVTGVVAAEYTGPAITISFVIAALACSFAGLCYAEFASMIPIAGSAYTYSYVTMGELVAYDALNRNESCGGHFREEYQTEEGEAKRDDENYFYVSCWDYAGDDTKAPEMIKEALHYEAIKVQTRNYKS